MKMHKITCFFIFLFGVAGVMSKLTAIQGLETAVKVVKVGADFFNSVTKEDFDLEKTALSFVESLPVIGDIVGLFTSPDNNQELEILQDIQKQLKSLANEQKATKDALVRLDRKIDLVVVQNQVATAAKGINSCFDDLVNLFNQPANIHVKNRFLVCEEKAVVEVRLLSRILNEDDFTYNAPHIFKSMIARDGFCNGTLITNAYRYIFGLFIDGCTAAITSESIKSNGTSHVLFHECKAKINDIRTHMESIFDICIQDSCKTVEDGIKSVVLPNTQNQLDILGINLSKKFPWFHFLIYSTTENPNAELEGNNMPSFATIGIKNKYYIILWTPFIAVQQGPSISFMLRFDASTFSSEYLGMNVSRHETDKTMVVMGYFDPLVVGSKTYQKCVFEEFKAAKVTSNSAKIVPLIIGYEYLLLFVVIRVF